MGWALRRQFNAPESVVSMLGLRGVLASAFASFECSNPDCQGSQPYLSLVRKKGSQLEEAELSHQFCLT
jgi:hypothetical protein